MLQSLRQFDTKLARQIHFIFDFPAFLSSPKPTVRPHTIGKGGRWMAGRVTASLSIDVLGETQRGSIVDINSSDG